MGQTNRPNVAIIESISGGHLKGQNGVQIRQGDHAVVSSKGLPNPGNQVVQEQHAAAKVKQVKTILSPVVLWSSGMLSTLMIHV